MRGITMASKEPEKKVKMAITSEWQEISTTRGIGYEEHLGCRLVPAGMESQGCVQGGGRGR
jgi:hypothetical protein